MQKLAFLLLFCFSSGLSFGQIDHWETAAYADSVWQYTVPTAEPSASWRLNGFADTTWNSGIGMIGYADGDDSTVVAPCTSVYLRTTFEVTDLSLLTAARLHIDYDDGFIAFLNGIEIARGNISEPTPIFSTFADVPNEAEVYQGGDYESHIVNNLSSLLNNGANVLAVQVHNRSATSSDLTIRPYLSFGIADTSTLFGPTPSWFVEPFEFVTSNLPIIKFETAGTQVLDSPRVVIQMGIINNGSGQLNHINDPFTDYNGDISIEIRGSSSQSFPKKQYALETIDALGNNNNVSLLGMPSENDWILYAPYSDKSLMRNYLTYHLANAMGRYAPRSRFCELVIDDEYWGVYILMEKIKQDNDRVDIANLTPQNTSGDELTGGYILKIDRGPEAWTSAYPNYFNVVLHDPDLDAIHITQLNYIKTHVEAFEEALDGPNFADSALGYAPYIDQSSFVDYMLMQELGNNVDGYRLSTFFHKERDSDGGRLVAGPLWDFNLAFGNVDYCDCGSPGNDWLYNHHEDINPFWFQKMTEDTTFQNAMHCRWRDLRTSGVLHTDSLLAYIDLMADSIADAADRNYTRWPILGVQVWPNAFVGNTFEEEIEFLKDWVEARLVWMDTYMPGNCYVPPVAVEDYNTQPELLIYPNPIHTNATVIVPDARMGTNTVFKLYAAQGKLVKQYRIDGNRLQFSVQDFSPGLYLYRLENAAGLVASGKVMVE